MGLDLWLVSASKPEGVKNYLPVKESSKLCDLELFSEKRMKEINCKTLKKNSILLDTEIENWNYKKIANEFSNRYNLPYKGLANKIRCRCAGPYYVFSCFYKGIDDKKYEIEVPSEQIKDYTYITIEKKYATMLKKVAYQRKDLNDKGWELMRCENCGYSDDFNMIKDMVAYGGLSRDFTDNWKDGETVFFPWW